MSVRLGPSNGLNVPATCLMHYGNLTRDCFENRLVSWFLGLFLG
jgi:hypothetical protein